MSIKPTLSVPLFGGQVTVHAFGREHGVNFSFKGFDKCPHEKETPHSTHPQIFEALASISSGVEAFCAPSPAKMNAEVVCQGEIPLMTLSGPFSEPGAGFSIYRGVDADGVRGLEPAYGYAMSAADCALIVVKNDNFIIATHAGRNSIIDMEAMKGGVARKHETVVHAIYEALKENYLQIQNTHVWIGFSISPGPHFEHAITNPKNPHNRKMVDYVCKKYGLSCFKSDGQGGTLGWLDTKRLIRAQFLDLGVPDENIELDSMCTYSDTDAQGNYVWFSNKRQAVHGEEQHRNLIAVVVNK